MYILFICLKFPSLSVSCRILCTLGWSFCKSLLKYIKTSSLSSLYFQMLTTIIYVFCICTDCSGLSHSMYIHWLLLVYFYKVKLPNRPALPVKMKLNSVSATRNHVLLLLLSSSNIKVSNCSQLFFVFFYWYIFAVFFFLFFSKENHKLKCLFCFQT